MDFPAGMFLKPVTDEPDLFEFALGGKALGDEAITVEENGDLIIQGYAAVWEGDDRQGENFMPGAFQRASKAFIAAGGPLCFHHKRDHVLGSVTSLEEDDKGLKFAARVDGAIQSHPVLGVLYQQIKSKTLRGVSVGGFFKRALINGKPKIADVDFTEISVTGVPMHTVPTFDVIAGKALADMPEVPSEVTEGGIREEDERAINWALEELGMVFDRISTGVQKRADNSTSA